MNPADSHVCRECFAPLETEAPWSEENTPRIVIGERPVAVKKAAVQKKNQKPVIPKFVEDLNAEKVTTSNRDAACKNHVPSVKKKIRLLRPGKFLQFSETTTRLEEILEGNVEVDHPLCVYCCDTIIETVDQRIKETEDEIRDEKRYLHDLDARKDEDDEESIEELQAELARLEAEERKLIKCCYDLEFERDITFKGRDYFNRNLADLEKSLERDTSDYFRLKNEWFVANEELNSLKNQYAYSRKRLETLNETNAFKYMFEIRCDDRIGEINGFRLGSLTVCPVTWKEINFAWGEAVFMLSFLAEMFEFDFKKYVLVPLGDRSRIEMPADKSEKLPLHFSGESEGQLFRFDAAQVAFLECLALLEGKIRSRFQDFKLKHSIVGHNIFERGSDVAYSIKHVVNTCDEWTKALKCVLVNLEQILTLFIEKIRDKQSQVSDQNE